MQLKKAKQKNEWKLELLGWRSALTAAVAMISIVLLVGSGVALDAPADSTAQQKTARRSPLERMLKILFRNRQQLKNLRFRTVIRAATGHEVLPLKPAEDVDAAVQQAITTGMDEVLEKLNQPDSPTNEEGRINEVSGHFEKALREELNARKAYDCTIPVNEKGEKRQTGYPDLRLVHKPSGRVAYIDPKLVAKGSLNNGFRTFYYSPKDRTNKVLEDAHHLLIGIEHDRNTGNWEFLKWHLVDLYEFRVNLKAEFQASNKDLYRPELVVNADPKTTESENE